MVLRNSGVKRCEGISVISRALCLVTSWAAALSLMQGIFPGGDGRRRIVLFAEASGGSGGGGSATLCLLVQCRNSHSRYGHGRPRTRGHPCLLRNLIPEDSLLSSTSVTKAKSVCLLLAISLRIGLRGSLKSPWSRRRRKHALLAKQWKSLFDLDGKLSDGGVRFLKKIRTGLCDELLHFTLLLAIKWFGPSFYSVAGVEISFTTYLLLNSNYWVTLIDDNLDYFFSYDVKSTKKERDSIRAKKRKEYVELRKQCRQISKRGEKSFKLKEISGNNSNEDSGDTSQVVDDSPILDEITSARPSISTEIANSRELLEIEEEDDEQEDNSVITTEHISEIETDSSDSDSSDDSEGTKPLLGLAEETEDNDLYEPEKSESKPVSYKPEDFATWQRIIRLDAIRANAEWIVYSPSQAAVSEAKAQQLAETVGLKDYDHLEPCRIYHAARLVSVLEAYALYDPEIGYCQGMSDLLSPIISVIEEDHVAFWCFVGFMRKARHNFRLDEVGIRRQLNIVSRIIKCKDSNLYKHLEKLQAEDCFFVYRMVVVLFRRELTFEQTLCLWEVMWADQAAIRAGIVKSAWRRMRTRAPPTEDLLLYAIAACVLQKRKLIMENYSSMDEIMRDCNSMAGHLDVWKLLDDAHDLVVTLHDKI
ncbi:GTPase-activating protein gyp7 [Phtheirospermum japonicum]|uniref:GTPase-activating protein gyp7 n=1 Tax=Phtheirospermum japonicum TaxID=374723 RepID=A0A830C1L2_9LAMI|nr:GTPase-activating protein gyp7 [Phtheirospermum japonicum]